MKRLLAIAAALVLVANAFVFARIAYNRSGEPRTIVLTERELPVPYHYSYHLDDNSGLNLQLQWRAAPIKPEDRYWMYDRSMLLDEQKFLSFGFHPAENCGVMGTEYDYRPRRDLPAEAWLALEYDGPAHAKVVEQQRRQLLEPGIKQDEREQRTRELEQLERRDTRLYVVDVAADRDELAAKYAGENYLILAATIGNSSECEQKYRIHVRDLLADTVHAPAQYAPLFSGLPERAADANWSPVYRITLAVGKLAEPWLLNAERIADTSP